MAEIVIRPYNEADAPAVGILIADTYRDYNLAFAPPAEQAAFLGPFRHARSSDPAHREAIAGVVRAEVVWVAEQGGEIVGVLRGRKGRLQSLFVRGDRQRRGIGRGLVERYEQWCIEQGATAIKVAATLYGLPFYLAMGYHRSTGLRTGGSFDGHGLPVQPMKKLLKGKGEGA